MRTILNYQEAVVCRGLSAQVGELTLFYRSFSKQRHTVSLRKLFQQVCGSTMEAGICKPDEIDELVKNGYSVGTEVHYFYQPCVGSDNDAALTVRNCVACYRDYSNRTLSCAQFCDKFESVLPWVYFTVSLVSMICCLGVFVTYCSFPRLRRSGYSSKVFLYR